MNNLNFIKSNLKMAVLGISLVVTLCGARGCCNLIPTAYLFGTNPDYIWKKRKITYNAEIQSDQNTNIHEQVIGTGYLSEYAFKIGLDNNVNCSDPTGYSNWTALSKPLKSDLSSYPNSTLRLCLVGRGTNPCQEAKFQSYEKATIYRWNLNRPLGTWHLTAPIGIVNSLTQIATWNSSANATSYRVFVSDSANCQNIIADGQNYTSHTARLSLPREGSYYLCGEARDGLNNSKFPSNNGVKFTIFSNSEEIILRDTIKFGPASTHMNLSIGNHSNQGSYPWYQLGLVKLNTPKRILLSRWSAHMDGSMPSPNGFICAPDLNGFEVKLRIWSSLDNVIFDPNEGDLANLDLTQIPPLARYLSGGISPTGCPIEVLEYNVASKEFILEPGLDYFVAMSLSSISGIAGVWGVMESNEATSPDWVIFDDLEHIKYASIINSNLFSQSLTGGLALRISGSSIP